MAREVGQLVKGAKCKQILVDDGIEDPDTCDLRVYRRLCRPILIEHKERRSDRHDGDEEDEKELGGALDRQEHQLYVESHSCEQAQLVEKTEPHYGKQK